MRTQTGDVAGTLDTMGPGTGQAETGAVIYPDLADRVGLPPRSALERGDVPIPPPVMTAVSTFSGVGGLDRGLELAGIESILMSEMDEWCQDVLRHRFPRATVVGDVRDVTQETIDEALARVGRLQPRADGRGAEHPEGGQDRRGLLEGDTDERARVDLLHGGFPCQDVSVAGRRAGLDGARTGLFFEFLRIAEALRPAWLLLENVPGLLTSNGGRDFGVILDALAELGYGVAWRVLDSRYFGVPQRRRRVFIVGRLGGDGASALRALCESCGGSVEAGSCSWQEPALRARASVEADGGLELAGALTRRHAGTNTARDGVDNLVSGPLLGGGNDRGYRLGAEEASSLVPTEEEPTYYLDDSQEGALRAGRGTDRHPLAVNLRGRQEGNVPEVDPDGLASLRSGSGGSSRSFVAPTLKASAGKGGNYGPEMPLTRIATTLSAGSHPNSAIPGRRQEDDVNLVRTHGEPDTAGTVMAQGQGSADPELETLIPTGAIPISSDALDRHGDAITPSPDAEGRVRLRPPGLGVGDEGDPSFTISATSPPGVYALGPDDQGDTPGALRASRVNAAPTIGRGDHHSDRGARVAHASGVRRLTPVECERLQGFPDGWTDVPGVKCPDSRRYAAMGNAVTCHVGEWIARRIVALHLAALDSAE